jgi:hypothetical protein
MVGSPAPDLIDLLPALARPCRRRNELPRDFVYRLDVCALHQSLVQRAALAGMFEIIDIVSSGIEPAVQWRWMAKLLKIMAIGRPGSHRLYLTGLILTLIVLIAPSGASAQQTLELQVPQGQTTQPSIPRSYPTAPPIVPRSNNVQTIPSAPPPALPESQGEVEEPPPPPAPPPPIARQPEPVLPPVFRGCWRGRVDEVDRLERLPGGAPTGLWMPKTYLLCYRRVGSGPFQLTFTEAGIEGTRITNTTGKLKLVSTDGRSYATMRGFLHFDEFRPAAFFGSPTFAVDEVTDLQCQIEPDGMHASGLVYGEHDGAPWFRAWWHATFIHEADLPP